MTRARFRLGIDFGTSTTIAVLQRPDGRVQQLLFDGSPLLSSAVLLGPDGRLHTGRDATHLARSTPERLEPNPKRRIDEHTVLLGDAEVGVRDLVAAVLRRVATEAARVAGPVDGATLTHPADWGSGRRALLVEAARLAGFADVDLIAEPVAAATYLAATQEVPIGSSIVVYDLGAGTCDVTLLRRRADGFEPVASGGLNDLGGLDVDAAVVAFLEATYGTLWTDPATRLRLWDDVRSAKEMLSRASGTVVMIPALGREVPLGREQLEGLTRPVLRPSVAMTRALLAEAGVSRAEIAGLFLVGGSSRIPLVATMLHEALGVAPMVAEQPELVVAEGALQGPPVARGTLESPSRPPLSNVGDDPTVVQPRMRPRVQPSASTTTTGAATVGGPSAGGASLGGASADGASLGGAFVGGASLGGAAGRRRSRTRLLVAVAAVAVLLVGGAVLLSQLPDDDGDRQPGSGSSAAAVRYDLARAPDNLCAGIDLTPFFALFEREGSAPVPRRDLMASAGSASCVMTRLHDNGVVRAVFAADVRITPGQADAAADYRMRISADAALNVDPQALKDLGDEAVIFEAAASSAQARQAMTLRIGVLDGNMTWQMRLSIDRPDGTDGPGWTAAQRQDLRKRLETVVRAALPKVTAGLVTAPR